MTGLATGPGILPQLFLGHASDYLPQFTLGRVFTAWELAPVLALLTLGAVFLYAMALNTLHGRGDRWPVGRTLAFAAGIVAFVLATQSGLAAYDTTLLSAAHGPAHDPVDGRAPRHRAVRAGHPRAPHPARRARGAGCWRSCTRASPRC